MFQFDQSQISSSSFPLQFIFFLFSFDSAALSVFWLVVRALCDVVRTFVAVNRSLNPQHFSNCSIQSKSPSPLKKGFRGVWRDVFILRVRSDSQDQNAHLENCAC
jgi:hypothetical protein